MSEPEPLRISIRDTNPILNELCEEYILIQAGIPPGFDVASMDDCNKKMRVIVYSMMQRIDMMKGGGMFG